MRSITTASTLPLRLAPPPQGVSGMSSGTDVPATPDASQAREAAERELARQDYQVHEDLWSRLWRWLLEHLDPSSAVPGVPGWLSTLIVLVVALVLVTVLVLMFARITRVRRARTDRSLFADDDRDSTALTRAADEAAAQRDWATAVVERFRAIIRSLDERGALEDYPGMTAHEAAAIAAASVIDHADKLHRAGALFDSVRYGEVVSTSEQDAWMRRLAETVQRAQLTPEPALASDPAWLQGGPS